MAKQLGAKADTSQMLRELAVKDLEITGISNLVGRFASKDLKTEHIKSLVRLMRLLRSKVEDSHAAVKLLLEVGFKLKASDDGSYDWKQHKNADEIQEKVNQLQQSFVILVPTNFIPEDVFYKAVSGLQAVHIEILEKVLSDSYSE